MVTSVAGPITSTTFTSQHYGYPDSELYMVDLGDGYIARVITSIPTTDYDLYSVSTNRYLVLTIEMATGLILSRFESVVLPIIFDGKLFIVQPAAVFLSIVKYDYTGLGIWTSNIFVTTETNLGFREPYIKFQHVSPTKLVLNNLIAGKLIEITDFSDLSKITVKNSPFSGADFTEFTETGVLGVNSYPGFDNVNIQYYNSEDYTLIPGVPSFTLNKANIFQQSYVKDGPGLSSDMYYFVQVYSSSYNGYAYRNNLEFSATYFSHNSASGTNNTGVSVYSTLAGFNSLTYAESTPQTGRKSYSASKFARKDTTFYVGIQYASNESQNCIGIAVLDIALNTAIVYSLALPNDGNTYTPMQTFVDSVGNVYARMKTKTTSVLLKLSNNVLTKLYVNVNDILPVGTHNVYTYTELPVIIATPTTTTTTTTTTAAPTTTLPPSLIWSTFTASRPNGAFLYKKTLVPAFQLTEYTYVSSGVPQ